MSSFYSGKVILTGEHSVVYGHTAILANLNLGITCTVKEGALSQDQNQDQDQDQYLQRILQIFYQHAQLPQMPLAIEIDSNLPVKSGLGSSAAFAAAVFSELFKFHNYSLNSDRLYNLVLEAENFIHTKSSGADPAIVVYGGLIAFSQGKIKPISNKALINQSFFLISSGEASESTGEMVQKVAAESNYQETLQKIGSLSQEMLHDLQNGVFNPELLEENQNLLGQIGVVGQKAQEIIRQLREKGAFCKITGAGGVKTGSGYILAWHKDPQKMKANLAKLGLEYFQTQLGVIYEKES